MKEKLNNEIIQLFIKYLNNQCSKTELEKVLKLIEEGSYKSEWEFVITEDAAALVNSNHQTEMPVEVISGLHDKIQNTITEENNKTSALSLQVSYWRKIAAAAAILITLSIGTFYYFSKQKNTSDLVRDIAPGGSKAILTLANGRKIILTDAKNGQLAALGNVVVTKLANGKIIYSVKPGKTGEASPNTIETPKGGQYQVILPDGSRVLLNAASVLTYPASFAGLKERRVLLKGEAYFEVAKVLMKDKEVKQRIPFIVVTGNQEIKVLGTHFNVNSYSDEPQTKTTLIEGSVQVISAGTKKVLLPGEQAIVGPNGLSISEANIDEVLAWKNGYFMFESEDIESVMRKIARWYDVDVVFEGDKPKDRFGGTVSRFSNVSQVLRKLELTNKIHFRIEERRIIVTK
ncbi:anti-sigma factor [Pedobacter sp. KBW01]|uniref:FecR family protein n=2 Tax=unclassified Pedobacter TaxID=2628915 RepID=UPI000F5B446B|nr:FecR family protein [Pedobacter sp. KBW01]RQO66597.1 anti-sigma factor [Pedobacter sp. KBW01]